MWSLVFLVATGRDVAGDLAGDDLAAEEYEQALEKLYNISCIAPFEVGTSEAMHYRRYTRAPVPMRRPATTSLKIRGAPIGRARNPPASARRPS